MQIRSRETGLLLLMMLLLASGGCIFSPDDTGGDNPVEPPVGLPFPDTPDKLIANFKTVYSAMDINRYRDEILSPDYTFVLQAETVEEFQLSDNIYEYADEVAIADKMFSGQPNLQDRVLSAIEIQTLQPQGAWLPVPANDPYFGGFPGARFRNYSLLFYFNMQGDFRYEVRGDQLFYVTADTVMHNGVMTPRYKLLGQLDQTAVVGP
jgi:hypothetical protein